VASATTCFKSLRHLIVGHTERKTVCEKSATSERTQENFRHEISVLPYSSPDAGLEYFS
jgi:hypothetical protein